MHLRKFKTKFVHYVAPSVWAYKPQRAAKCAKLFDHLLALLPFEPPYFEKAGLASTWVGHPVIAETQTGDGRAFREKYEIAEQTRLFCLLPGSRKGEVERHMPVFAKTVAMLAAQLVGHGSGSRQGVAARREHEQLPRMAPSGQRGRGG